MLRVNIIENSLKEIGSAKFEKLCKDYLYERGFKVSTPGSTIGKNKSNKGVPDFYIFADNKFTLIECTTSLSKKFLKLKNDLINCLNTQKTGITLDAIKEIKLIYNFVISAKEAIELARISGENHCMLELIDISILANEINRNYPHLAKEYFGISFDTNQILKPKQFINEYQKNKLTVGLDNEFMFRESKLEEGLQALAISNLLIIRGETGTGKTRFALRLQQEFIKNNTEFNDYVIMNKSLDHLNVYEDSKYYFKEKKKYLIIIDDANRGIANLRAILLLLSNESITIKIIVTVRDYALAQVEKITAEYDKQKPIEIRNFNYDEFKKILEIKFPNFAYDVIEKIYEITKGNPRLGMMCGELVFQSDNIYQLYNVTQIFDSYYGVVLDELDKTKKNLLLKILGIISFLRIVNRDDEALSEKIAETFNIDKITFWDTVFDLNEMEIVDLYENKYVKFSDQLLQTFIFYKVFFEDELLNYGILLKNFSNNFRSQDLILDSLNPTLSNFESIKIKDKLQKHFDFWLKSYEYDIETVLKIFKYFWFVNEEKTLRFIYEHINQLVDGDLTKINFDVEARKLTNSESKGYISDNYFEILQQFHQSSNYFIKSLELIFLYLEKRPDRYVWIIKYIKEKLGYDRSSFRLDYFFQCSLFEYLIDNSDDKRIGYVFKNVIFEIANSFLETYNRVSYSLDRHSVTMATIPLTLSPVMKNLRKTILEYIFANYKSSKYREKVLTFLEQYIHPREFEVQESIYKFDMKFLIPFIDSNLDSNSFYHCKLVNEYLEMLKRRFALEEDNSPLKNKFSNETYKLYEFLKWDERRELNMNEEKFSEYLEDKFNSKFSHLNLIENTKLILQIEEIIKSIEGHTEYQVKRSYEIILENLAKRDAALFFKVIKEVIKNGNEGKAIPHNAIREILHNYANCTEELYDIITNKNYEQKYAWIWLFFYNITEKSISKFYVHEFYSFIKDSTNKYFCIINYDFFKNYELYDKDIFIKTMKILMNRTKEKDFKVNFLYLLFRLEDDDYILNKFKTENLSLLKKIYIYQIKEDPMDYNKKIFIFIIEKDENFIIEYLSFKFKESDYVSSYQEHGDFRMLWELDNYNDVITTAIEFCNSRENSSFYGDGFHTVFFKKMPLDIKVETYIKNYILKNKNDIKNLNIIFSIITSCYKDKRIYFLSYLFDVNGSFKDFEKLFLEKRSWSGDLMVEYKKCKLFWIGVKEFLYKIKKTKFLPFVIKNIERYESMIKNELEKKFMETN